MRKRQDFQKVLADINSYDEETQVFLKNLQFKDAQIGLLNEMKATSGWKLLEKKIREELQTRIKEKVQDDLKIQTLLALLTVAETNSLSKELDAEIERILPNE